MHPADIQSALKKANLSSAEIARQCAVSRVSVGRVVLGRDRSERIETAISEATQLPLHVLWPQYYSAPVGSSAPTPAPKAPAVDPLGELLLREWRRLDMANKARLLEMVAEMNRGVEQRMAETAAAIADAPKAAAAEGLKAIKDIQSGREVFEGVNTGIQIGRNFGQVNKGGKKTKFTF